jgi:hypothetical protein
MTFQFFRFRVGLLILCGVMSIQTASAVVAVSNSFGSSWTVTGSQFVDTNRAGWVGSSVRIGVGSTDPYFPAPKIGLRTCWLNSMLATTNSWIQPPFMTNGVGTIQLVQRIRFTLPGFNTVAFQVSPDGTNDWLTVTNQTYTDYGSGTWGTNYIVLNIYEPTFLRFLKIADDGGDQAEGLDMIVIHYPPTRVVITNVALVPSPAYSNGAFQMAARIPTLGIISNLTATNFYRIGGGGPWTALGMASNGPNSWITTNVIPGQLPGTLIQYAVTAYFQGPDAMSPTSYPTAGTSAPLSFVVKDYPTSDYNPTSMVVFGALSTNMILVSNYTWEAFFESAATLTNVGIRWRGVSRTNPAITNIWGETNQTDSAFRLDGTAEIGGTNVILSGTNSGQFVLTFNETNRAYIINHGYWENFDAWNYTTTSRADWVSTNGTIITDPTRILRNNSLLLGPGNSVRSAFLQDGIGEVVFAYRNYQTNGLPLTALRVQKSVTGSSEDADWFTMTNLLTIAAVDYGRAAFTVEDRNNRYIRIQNTSSNGFVALDEIRIHDPYFSGVVGSNLTVSPSSPTATNPVTVSLDLQPFSGASDIRATLYYRPAGAGSYASIVMSNFSGVTYTTVSPIPAGIGPNYRAGNVQYYIRCSFTGDQSSVTSPVDFPTDGSNTPAFYTIQTATTLVENLTLTPDPPLTLTNTQVEADITPLAAGSNVTANLYYRFGTDSPGGGGYSQTPMTDDSGHFTGSIPAFDYPGTPLQYYIEILFLGPGAPSLVNKYPADGFPITAWLRAAPLVTLYTNLTLSGSFSTNLLAVSNYLWQGIASVSNLSNPSFRFIGYDGSSNVWGDSSPTVTNLPLFGDATNLNGNAIQISGVLTGYYRFRFDETSRVYSVVKCQYLNFDYWSTPSGYATYTNADLWVIGNSRTTIASADDVPRVFRGKSGIMNETGVQPYIRSPYLAEGVGEISFWYRNWESNSVTPGTLLIQKAANPNGPWTQIGQITNILSFDYLFYYLAHSDRDSFYVRLISSNLPPRLCVDEITVTEPPAGVRFSNLTSSPTDPSATNPVTISVTITNKAGASNLNATLFYRTSGTQFWSSNTMYRTNGTLFVSPPIPPGIGPNGGAGLVDYYVQCAFDGYFSKTFSPEIYPSIPTNYRIIPASVLITNLTLVPNPPLVNSNFDLWIDVIPLAAAYNVKATAFYRFANSGAFSSLTLAHQGTNRYKTITPLPLQSNPGTPLQFYFTVELSGPAAMSPTNYPVAGATAPFSNVVYRKAAFTSDYAQVETSGSFTGSLIRIEDWIWQAVIPLANLTNPAIRFAGFDGVSNFWGDNSQTVTNLPAFGTADPNGSPITLPGVQNGTFILRFNETNQTYSIQQCTYMNFDGWATLPDQTFSNFTYNSWSLNNGRTTTNSAAIDQEHALRGRSAVLGNSTGLTQSLVSPYLTNGIGTIAFWYRNWETNGLSPSTLYVEKAISLSSGWVRVATITNILSLDYLHFNTALSDRAHHYVRILNATNPPKASICLDEVVISDPPAGVAFSNVVYSPSDSYVTNTVTISVEIYPFIDATNFAPVVWYRAGTSGGWDSMPMIPSGGAVYTTSNPIPRGAVGVMQYFFECGYSGFMGELTSPTYYPLYGADGTPLVYTNRDTWRVQTFNDWPDQADPIAFTNDFFDGWTTRLACVRGSTNTPPFPAGDGGTKACWLDQDYNSWVQSPLFSNGVGGIVVLHRPRVSPATGNNVFNIDKSYDGDTWVNVAQITSPGAGWTTSHVAVLELAPIYIRFTKIAGDNQSNQGIGLDTLRITYHPAKTVISNVVVHPGYPASNDAVYVSCDIYSVNPFSPAIGMQSFLYYRIRDSGPYLGPVSMTRSGNSFRTDTALKFPRNVWVDYYISNSFNGYAFISNTISEKQSPLYHPVGGAAAPAAFWVREFQSDFDQFSMSLNGDSLSLIQFADNIWQGVVNWPPTNQFEFSWRGEAPYNGTNILGSTYVWGDDYQWKTNAPLSSTARLGEAPIQIQGNFDGQYLFRFYEETGAYTFRRCAWQNFDSWGTTSNYLATANDNTQPAVQNFNAIPTNTDRVSSSRFETWALLPTFTNEFWGATGSNGTEAFWGILSAKTISGGPVGSTKCVQTTNFLGRGFVVRDMLYNPLRGVGTVKFDYRVASASNPVGVALYLCPTNQDYRFPNNWLTNIFFSATATGTMSFVTNWSYTTNYYDLTNYTVTTNYEGIKTNRTAIWTNAVVPINTNGSYHVIIAQAVDTSSLMIDNVQASEWYASDLATNGWTMSGVWLTPTNARLIAPQTNGVCAEFDATRALGEMWVRTPTLPGISFFEFWYRGKTTNPVSFRIDFQQNENIDTANWIPLLSVSNQNPLSWAPVSFATNVNPLTLYAKMRLVNTSPRGGILLVDDLNAIPVSSATNIWRANNAKIDESDTSGRLYLNRSMYLNSNATSEVGQNDIPTQNPYLRTVDLPEGIGEINFRFRNWNTTPAPAPATIQIQKSVTGGGNAYEWSSLATLSNIVNSSNYSSYVLGLYDITSRYVRIVNQTPGSRVCLDEVMVAAALSSDLTISNLTLNPLVPINSNATHVVVDISEFFLSPSNIQLVTRYALDPVYEGPQWSNEFSSPMSCIDSNPEVPWYRFQTVNPIPAQPADTFVKYYIAASFDGYYADLVSPKIHKIFTEPDWYDPMFYGTNVPYYISYVCEPGRVWINELNIIDWSYYLEDTQGFQYQYIELAGPAGVDIQYWTVEIVDVGNNLKGRYVLPANSILPSTYEGYGFFTLGTTNVIGRNMTLTNLLDESGGIRLYRSMGALEYAIAYGNQAGLLAPYGFANINVTDDWIPWNGPLQLTGTATNYTEFGWTADISGNWSPGDRNNGQDILGGGTRMMITPSIATNAHRGQIVPSIPILVTNNAQTNFVITASNYWYVADVLTNGASIGSISGFSNTINFVFSNIIAPATIKGVILPRLAPSNTPYEWLASYGFGPNFTVAETNDQDNDGRLTWQEYREGTVPTNFHSARIILAPTAGVNTAISPSTNFWVYKGSTTNLTITASNYWIVADVLTNGASLAYAIPLVSQYTFVYSNIEGDRTTTVQSVAGPALATLGTPLAWLAAYGWTNNFDAAETNDADNDGRLTWEEYREGTIPTNYYSAYIEMNVSVEGDGSISPSGYLWIAKGITTNFIVQANAFASIYAIKTNDAPIAEYLVGRDYYSFSYTNIQADRVGSVVAIFTNAVSSNGTPFSWLASFGFSGNLQAADDGDADNDGRVTWQEYIDGTNPTNFNSAVVLLVPQVDLHGQIAPNTNIWAYKGASTSFLVSADTYFYVTNVTTNAVSIGGSFGSNSYLFNFGPIYVDRTGVVRGVIAPYTAALGTPLYWLHSFGFTNNFNQAETNDVDDDGRRTWQEYLDGTVPTNFYSALIEIVPQVEPFGQITPGTNFMILKGSSTNFSVTSSNYFYVAGFLTNGVAAPGDFGTRFFDFTYLNAQGYRTNFVQALIRPYIATQGTPVWWLSYYGYYADYDEVEVDDDDLDFMLTRDEYWAGTIPTNPVSVFRIVRQGRLGGSNYIQWLGGTVGPTNPYAVYYSTNLQTGAWWPTGRVNRTEGTNTLWLVVPTNRNAFFYRISATN